MCSADEESELKAQILIIEDEADTRVLLVEGLEQRGFKPRAVESAEEALELLESGIDFSTLLTDVRLENMSGLELCRRVKEMPEAPPVVIMTAYSETDLVVDAMRAHAYDFVTKPASFDEIEVVLRRSMRDFSLQRQVQQLTNTVGTSNFEDTLLGESDDARELQGLIEQVGPTDTTVLVTGESGTGKELVARSIHKLSGRTGKFLAINCAAMPPELLESELFGHEKGSFTGAQQASKGLFVAARDGTLFLDEIGDMPIDMQVKLLRALQEKKVRPVGRSTEVEVNARIVAATNIDLERAVEEGRFRRDLYYRINVVNLELRPLRDRGNDILLLAMHFIALFASRAGRSVSGLSAEAAERLMRYDWPGNVRELENAIERAVTLCTCSEITTADLAPRIRDYGRKSPRATPLYGRASLEEVEKQYITQVLRMAEGNKTRAAQVLGIDRRTLYRRIGALDIQDPSRTPRSQPDELSNRAASGTNKAPSGSESPREVA